MTELLLSNVSYVQGLRTLMLQKKKKALETLAEIAKRLMDPLPSEASEHSCSGL